MCCLSHTESPPAQLHESFPKFTVTKEGSAADFLVVLLLDGQEVWRADTREVPVLAAGTTNIAVAAVHRAVAPFDEARALQEVEGAKAPLALDGLWIGKLDCWVFS